MGEIGRGMGAVLSTAAALGYLFAGVLICWGAYLLCARGICIAFKFKADLRFAVDDGCAPLQ